MSLQYSTNQHFLSVLGLEFSLSLLYFGATKYIQQEIIKTKLSIFKTSEEMEFFMNMLKNHAFEFLNVVFYKSTIHITISYQQKVYKIASLKVMDNNNSILKNVLISPLDSLYIMSIIQFSDEWLFPFDSNRIYEMPFKKENNRIVYLPTMKSENCQFCHLIGKDYEIIILRYRKGAEFVIIFGKNKFEININEIPEYNSKNCFIGCIYLPKFKMKSDNDFTNTFKILIPYLFVKGALPFISYEETIIDKIFSFSDIEVAENKTLVNSINTIEIKSEIVEQIEENNIFAINQTFRFFIRYQEYILFHGVYNGD